MMSQNIYYIFLFSTFKIIFANCIDIIAMGKYSDFIEISDWYSAEEER